VKKNYLFHKAVDNVLDTNGFFSVCKACANDLYAGFLSSEGNTQKAILRMCRILNVAYNESAIEAALKQVEVKGGVEEESIWGLYRAKLIIQLRTYLTDDTDNLDLTFQPSVTINTGISVPSEDDVEYDVVKYWGKGYQQEDYFWLEETLSDWKKTHKCDTKAEETLLREIVFKQFEIEKSRNDGGKTSPSLVKELQDLMKTASVDPAKSNEASAGKSKDTFSAFIKMIEEDEPAEVFGDERDAFKDFQGIEKYFEKYVVRPLKNFITMSRDFNVESDGEDNENEFDKFEDFLPEVPEIEIGDIKKLEE
jgi:hypothetical protein